MAKKYKYIIGSGIAISPEKDMALFTEMSKQGWHLCGSRFIWYRFEKGEPAEYDYASNMEAEAPKDMLSLYRESGWSPVISWPGLQIFRAKAGATPIFTDKVSEIEALEGQRRNMFKASVISGLSAILLLAVVHRFLIPSVSNSLLQLVILLLPSFVAAVFGANLVSFVGICRILRKKRKQAGKG